MAAQIKESVEQMGKAGRFKIYLENLEESVKSVANIFSFFFGEVEEAQFSLGCVVFEHTSKWKCPACSCMDATGVGGGGL